MKATTLITLTALMLGTGVARAEGDAAEGKRLATQWCSGCHAVAEGGTDMAPPLTVIAGREGRDEQYLFLWLSDPHPPMPQLQLSRREIGDIIAYLQTLQTSR